MFTRLSNSWELVKASAAVLRADKELIFFPLISSIATLLVMISFAIPMAIAGVFDNMADQGSLGPAGVAVGFVFYLVMYFITIFANTALVGAVMIRLDGGDPTLRDGFQIALDHLGQIFGYALISATVGMVLRWLSERGGIVGGIVSFLGGIAWSLATYLVVPVLVVEDIGPVDAVKRSANLLKRTWGEQITGNFSIGLVFGLLTVGAFFAVGLPLILLAAATESVLVIVFAIGAIVLLISGIALLGSTLNGIYVAAVYRYATQGVINDEYFSPEMVRGAFKPKRG
jgi:hypothetical protein